MKILSAWVTLSPLNTHGAQNYHNSLTKEISLHLILIQVIKPNTYSFSISSLLTVKDLTIPSSRLWMILGIILAILVDLIHPPFFFYTSFGMVDKIQLLFTVKVWGLCVEAVEQLRLTRCARLVLISFWLTVSRAQLRDARHVKVLTR